ncbi:MAG: AmmeMemoRadiSam system protein B, partial [Aquificota bacterium]
GRVRAQELKKLIEHFCKEDTLFVISSDLSHYYDEQTAKRLDSHCHAWILYGDKEQKGWCEACGKKGIEGALLYAKGKNMRAILVHYSTSAKASGDRSRVVGYGGYAFIS